MWVARTATGVFFAAGLCLVCAAPPSRADPAYKGVTPGSDVPAAHALPGPPGAELVTFPGFSMRPDGRSVVFVQTGVEPEPDLRVDGRHVTLALPGLRLPPGNVRRPLDTRFFDSPVTRVSLQRRRKGVVVHVALRAPVEPALEVERAETGYYFVMLTFPDGDYRAP